ncbi:MAG: immunoglobulin-like domain-containing protein [Bacillota bacterium]
MKNKRRWLALIGLIVILTGCTEASLGDINREDLYSHVERGETIDTSFEVYITQANQPEALAALLGEEVLTGEWFMNNNDGQVGYTTLSGYQDKNTIQPIQLFSYGDSQPEPITVRLTISQLEPGDAVSEGPVISETTFENIDVADRLDLTTVTIPESDGVYLYRLESLRASGEVTDRVLSVFYNVLPKLDLALEVEHDTGTEATWVLHNYGQTQVTFGVDYALEKYDDGEWRKVPLDLTFIEIAVQLAPGETYENDFSVEELARGEYRLVKTIQVPDYGESFTLQAPFLIE